jgi:hypothetical protein
MDESPCGRQCGAQGVLIGQRIGCKLDRRTDFDSWKRGTVMLTLKRIRLPTLPFLPRRNGEPPGLRRRLRGVLIKKVGCGPVGLVCRKRNSEPRLLTESAMRWNQPQIIGTLEEKSATRETSSLKRIANDIELVLHQLETVK